MIPKLSFTFAALAIFHCIRTISFAQAGGWNIRTELFVLSASEPLALDFARRYRTESSREVSESLWKEVELEKIEVVNTTTAWTYVAKEMVWSKKDPGELVESMQRASDTAEWRTDTSEILQELRYPTEFEPPQTPQNFGGATTKPKRPAKDGFATMPNAFETRNLGLSLDVNCLVQSPGLISLKFGATYVWLERFHSAVSIETKKKYGIWDQPEFRTVRVQTSLAVKSGEWDLVNVSRSGTAQEQMLLLLLRSTAMPVQP